MVKTFDQPKREAIIICPQHGRLETRPEPGYVKDKAGNSHFFHLAYCSQCGTFYTTYRTLIDIWAEPKQNGVPIRTVDPVSPHEAKRLDDARKAAAAAARRKEEQRIRAAAESRSEREEWEEFFAPKEMDFATLYAQSLDTRPRSQRPAARPKAQAAPVSVPKPAADPYAKAEPAAVEAVTLTKGTLKTCPADGSALAQGLAWLELKSGRKKLSGVRCPECGVFYVNRRSFECLRLAADDIVTEIREGE